MSCSDYEDDVDLDWTDMPIDEFLNMIVPRINQNTDTGKKIKTKDEAGQKVV